MHFSYNLRSWVRDKSLGVHYNTTVLFLSSERELLRKSRAAKAGGRTVLKPKAPLESSDTQILGTIFQGDTT